MALPACLMDADQLERRPSFELRAHERQGRQREAAHVASVLDVPSGHGRVARYIRAGCPDATLYFYDLDAEGAEFCAETFNGTAIPSQPELSAVPLPTVDLIWVGSLFTHVDRARTERWLQYLSRHLNDHGVLHRHILWTLVHRGAEDAPDDRSGVLEHNLRGHAATGFGYAPYPGDAYGDFGQSLCKAPTVMEIAGNIEGVRVNGSMERGWADHQDVLMLTWDDRLRRWT